MTDTNYSTQQHGQYITNKSFAEQIARLEGRVAALESALAQPEQTRICVCVESIKPHPIKGWEIT